MTLAYNKKIIFDFGSKILGREMTNSEKGFVNDFIKAKKPIFSILTKEQKEKIKEDLEKIDAEKFKDSDVLLLDGEELTKEIFYDKMSFMFFVIYKFHENSSDLIEQSFYNLKKIKDLCNLDPKRESYLKNLRKESAEGFKKRDIAIFTGMMI